jgi:hypothetical protein
VPGRQHRPGICLAKTESVNVYSNAAEAVSWPCSWAITVASRPSIDTGAVSRVRLISAKPPAAAMSAPRPAVTGLWA